MSQYSYLMLVAALISFLLLVAAGARGQQFKPQLAPPAVQSGNAYMPGRIIIKLGRGIIPIAQQDTKGVSLGVPAIDRLNAQYNCLSVTRLNTGMADRNTSFAYRLNFAATADVQALVKAYMGSNAVAYAEPDYVVSTTSTTPNDPYFQYSWGLNNAGAFAYSAYTPVAGADMDMKRAWDITQGSSAITVAVIDAGAKLDHPEFAGRIWQNTAEIAGNGIDDDGNGYIDDYQGWNFVSVNGNPTDDNGHGTNVMGIIGANGNNGIGYAGVDWHCKLMVLKTQNSSGSGSYSDMASAIYYATDNGAKVINMSLGGSAAATALQSAINYAYAHNVTVVAAMGNNNSSIPSYPGACTHVIAVGASTCADTRASFSNYGSHISVVAPGDVIFGLSYLSNTNYSSGMSGTSQATPAVAGVLALLLAQNPSRTPDQLRTIIESTAEDQVGSPAEDVHGFDVYYGHGRVNAYAALSGCTAPVVGVISSAAAICAGTAITLTDTTLAGTWGSSNALVATVNASGLVSALTAGTAIISYTKTNSCGTTAATRVITVNAIPSAITGIATLCAGSTAALASTPAGGSWSSSAVAVATIAAATGIATGVSNGTATVTYNKAGCTATKVVTVSPGIAAITAPPIMCPGSMASIIPSVAGGTWSSSNTGVATISAAGLLTGVATGTANITYAVGTAACRAITPVTVGGSLPAITGTAVVCPGATTALANAATGGVWSTSNTVIAAISVTGMVTGIAAGAATITYTLPGGCYRTLAVTVKTPPTAISGNTALCVGATSVVTNGTGVSWTSGNPSVATIGVASGVVTGIAPGTAVITFLATNGCTAAKVVTVDAAPATPAIAGPVSVPAGATISLAATASGGTWSSSSTARATVDASGVVTGIAAPAATISYTIANGACKVSGTKQITITAHKDAAAIAAGISSNAGMSLYPNPTSGSFNLNAPVAGQLSIYTLDGREVMRTSLVLGANALTLPAGLTAGIYLCRLVGEEDSVITTRLVYQP